MDSSDLIETFALKIDDMPSEFEILVVNNRVVFTVDFNLIVVAVI